RQEGRRVEGKRGADDRPRVACRIARGGKAKDAPREVRQARKALGRTREEENVGLSSTETEPRLRDVIVTTSIQEQRLVFQNSFLDAYLRRSQKRKGPMGKEPAR